MACATGVVRRIIQRYGEPGNSDTKRASKEEIRRILTSKNKKHKFRAKKPHFYGIFALLCYA
jgi:hypothetical protein